MLSRIALARGGSVVLPPAALRLRGSASDPSPQETSSASTEGHPAQSQSSGGGTQVHRRGGRGRRHRGVGDEFDQFRNLIGNMMEDFEGSLLGRGGRRGGFFGGMPMLPSLPLPGFGRGGFFGDRGQPDERLMLGDTADMDDTDALALPTSTAGTLDLFRPSTFAPMRVDVEEEKDKYIISAEAPGFKKEDLHVRVENGLLTITGEHREERKQEDKERKMLRTERSMQSVRRTLQLSDDTEQTPEKVKARYQDGVLKVEIPKRPEGHRAGSVAIESGSESQGKIDTGAGAKAKGAAK